MSFSHNFKEQFFIERFKRFNEVSVCATHMLKNT